ncbi:unnamed protein product [Darwinula stevensoni]|uniref:Uncharacterized protein n=1 Tax=Darwinula stevensoni TaxID=69355 RepID=A0A7R8XA98_9CRUS|nr:unnamed protein product [Darwinula stevensoni]CAG0891198.1 unnamed protein product [Darwinula stevensoni]
MFYQAKEGDASQSGNGDTAPKSPGVRRFQQIHHLWDQRSSPSGPNQDGDEGDNAREEMNGRSGEDNERKLTNGVHREPPEVIHNDKYVNDDLSLTTQQLREEVKRLRKEVTQRDKRIRELQGQIRLLTSHPS